MEGLTRDRVVAYAKLAKGADISLEKLQGRWLVVVANGEIRFAADRCLLPWIGNRGTCRTLNEVVEALQHFNGDPLPF